MQTLAEIIKEYRSEHNLSLREFSNLCGVSHTYIDKIEKNRDPRNGKAVEPTLDMLEKMSFGLNLTLKELLTKLGKIQPNTQQDDELLKKVNSKEDNEVNELINRLASLDSDDKNAIKKMIDNAYYKAVNTKKE
ncbi:TPA: helix-turn-helix transcriptional regulator [Clostridioides difficile]|jgi:transcriptional regulator with XRE-family HTH domain|uniref:Lambda repressor-like DNA-binding protein n=4 Tax=root TaxID=1 RepID=J9QE24_9CAUD|nr:helix-turn-helix transcriptional regulator [Clostridioides difficile]YP_006990522.1 helix-turn-helix domain-containing protein [Clostridium phage phiMMP02]YP_009195805.1 helix-turn-helix domain-containing protein [Clostridium phage phiCD505]EQI49906.1 helix-turn-helix family protein [Clostridioides difficile Y184]EQK81080.1 helix-turn-helix family protein [Clostridioides difficile CD127]AFO72105.1 lambda repressor-like DNA-binding protein [Clostridium phage phiMMP02]AUA20362.1 XRE family t